MLLKRSSFRFTPSPVVSLLWPALVDHLQQPVCVPLIWSSSLQSQASPIPNCFKFNLIMRLGSINTWHRNQKQMGSICVSSAPILRCISLTQTENIALIIPVALEFATSSSFLFFNRGFGGWVFFLRVFFCFLLSRIQETLAVVDRGMGLFHSCNARASFGFSSYISSQSITIPCLWYGHRYPSVYSIVSSQNNLLRILPGIASFLPLILYTLFLYLFARGELFKNLPPYVKIVAQVALLFSLPAIVATNEIASVVGLTISEFHWNKPFFNFEFRPFVIRPQSFWHTLLSILLYWTWRIVLAGFHLAHTRDPYSISSNHFLFYCLSPCFYFGTAKFRAIWRRIPRS